MDKNLAIRMTHLVNTQMEVLTEYANWRIELLRRSLEAVKTIEELNSIKGQINEVRRLITLKDEVLVAREAD